MRGVFGGCLDLRFGYQHQPLVVPSLIQKAPNEHQIPTTLHLCPEVGVMKLLGFFRRAKPDGEDWLEDYSRKDLVRTLRAYAKYQHDMEQTLASVFPDDYPYGDGENCPSDERYLGEAPEELAERVRREVEHLRDAFASLPETTCIYCGKSLKVRDLGDLSGLNFDHDEC